MNTKLKDLRKNPSKASRTSDHATLLGVCPPYLMCVNILPRVGAGLDGNGNWRVAFFIPEPLKFLSITVFQTWPRSWRSF